MAETLLIDGLRVAKASDSRVLLVDDVCLELREGHTLALVGSSGSGKSLTCAGSLEVMAPGVRKLGGTLVHQGQRVEAAAARGRLVSIVMQNPATAFNPVYTMAGHVRETLQTLGRRYRAEEPRVRTTLEEVGLDSDRVLGLYPFQMSGGMLQRMMIALALLSEAPFLFADEPTTDLDLLVQEKILTVLESVSRSRGLGVLLITHDLGVVARLAQDVAVIQGGRIVERLGVHQLFENPTHPASQTLVSAHRSLYPEDWHA